MRNTGEILTNSLTRTYKMGYQGLNYQLPTTNTPREGAGGGKT